MVHRLTNTRLVQRLRQRRSPLSRSIGWIVDEVDIIRKYGRPRPDHLQLVGSDCRLFVDPTDRRGRFLLRHEALYAAHLKDFWQWAAAEYAPTVVLDVGLNYGEFLFSGVYKSARRVIGIEANPNLKPWNLRSQLSHPDADLIEIHYVVATDNTGSNAVFYVDRRWSGTSAVAIHGKLRRHIPITVPTMTIDELLSSDLVRDDRILFKIDVEGHEPSVLRGMEKTLDECGSALGVVEFIPRHLAAGGSASADKFYASLCEQFEVYAWRHLDEPIPGVASVSALQGTMALESAPKADAPPATDLLLALGPEAVAAVEAYRSQRVVAS